MVRIAARRAFSQNFLMTECDAVRKLAGLRPTHINLYQVADGHGLPRTVGTRLSGVLLSVHPARFRPGHQSAASAKHPNTRQVQGPGLLPVDLLWRILGLRWITPGGLWTFCGYMKHREITYQKPLAWALATGVEISHYRKWAPSRRLGRTWDRGTGTAGGYPAW